MLFEVFPYRYYKRGYGPLGGEYGVIHGGAMSPPGAGWLARAVLSLLPTKVLARHRWTACPVLASFAVPGTAVCSFDAATRCSHITCLPALQP